MAICGCGFPARYCQPAVAGGFIYADLRGELNTHLALQALFTQSSVCEPLLQAFPFPSTLGEVTLHPLSQACMFVYSSCEKWVSPLSCGVFLPPPLSQTFPLLVAGCAPLLPPSPAQPGLFIYSSRKDSPPLLRCSVPHPLCYMSLLFLLLITQILFFPWVGVSLSGGLCWSGPGLSVGVPRYHLAHLVHVFPSCLGMGDWWPGGPPGFSI
jgi:hypothetical protein